MKRMGEEVGCVKKKNMFARLALSPAILGDRGMGDRVYAVAHPKSLASSLSACHFCLPMIPITALCAIVKHITKYPATQRAAGGLKQGQEWQSKLPSCGAHPGKRRHSLRLAGRDRPLRKKRHQS